MDIPLSDEGLMQADLLGKYLRNDKFTSIYASDLKRAYQVKILWVGYSLSCIHALPLHLRLKKKTSLIPVGNTHFILALRYAHFIFFNCI